ncbi:hypothetical protein D9M69_534180 [compost metagenome]
MKIGEVAEVWSCRTGTMLWPKRARLWPSGRATCCTLASSFSAKPASKKRSMGMSSPSSQTTGSVTPSMPSLPWSCQAHEGVMMKSPGCIVVRSPPTVV